MTAAELIIRLNAHGITLTIADNAASLNVTGPLTPDLREVIRMHKAELINELACPLVVYPLANLYGQMPDCHRLTDNGQVVAYYRTEAELREHVNRIRDAKRKIETATDLISAALALGGEFVPSQEPEDEIPF